MDWLTYAKSDWEIYHDKTRIARYVEFNKITEQDYQVITGEAYAA